MKSSEAMIFAVINAIFTIDHFTVLAKLPGLRMEARLPVTLVDTNLSAFVMLIRTN